jgi:hypothetical protein
VSSLDELFISKNAIAIPDVIANVADVRAQIERGTWTRYPLVDRGSYAYQTPELPDVIATMVRAAEAIRRRRQEVVEARLLKLVPGDYLLAHHDRRHDGLELALDLSQAAIPGVEIHYRQLGEVYFAFGGPPGAMAIVERDKSVICNHTYVSKLHRGASIVRLMVRLRTLFKQP